MTNSYSHITVSRNRHILVLTIVRERIAEYQVAEATGNELIAAAQQGQSRSVIVDMGNVEFMSSVGYGPLVSLRGSVQSAGGRLVLCRLSDPLKEMFETTRLLINPQSPRALFEYANTLEEAMDADKPPISKPQNPNKLQFQMAEKAFRVSISFGTWDFGFVWDLAFGIWRFTGWAPYGLRY